MKIKTIFVFLIILSFSEGIKAQTFGERLQRTSDIQGLLDLKDPFKSPIKKATKKKAKEKEGLLKNGVYTNISDVKNLDVNKVEILGVLVGKNRRAVAKVAGIQGTFILKEGMKLGINNVELKAILPGGVIFVEKLSNLYGEDEYLETVIPITE